MTKKNIYHLLAKHFQKIAHPDEEKLITVFREKNPLEYQQLKKLWFSKRTLKVFYFDTHKGWQNVLKKVTPQKGKIIRLYQNKMFRVAAAVAVIVLLSIPTYFLTTLLSKDPFSSAEVTATNGNKLVLLDDGSKIWLNENATLIYPTPFETNYRKVKLFGQAYFEIEENPSKPFIVETNNAQTTALGTSFNINSNEKTTEVTVASGLVEVISSFKEKVVITPGYTATVSNDNLSSYLTTNLNFLSWKSGVFIFKETELASVIEQLNTYYSEPIKIENSKALNCRITATFHSVPLEEIMGMIALTYDLSITRSENSFLIH
ncbi:MAG: FecR family protein [Flavobacteriaceae bacterium]|nr:FecR family protein [Flavobacteriaceae bacterium]